MKKRLLNLSILCLLPATVFSGCFSKPTTESVLTKTKEAMTQVEDFEGDFELDCNLKAESSGINFTINLGLDGDVEYVVKDDISHIDGQLKLSILGQNETVDMEVYQTPDVTYTKANDEWSASDNEAKNSIYALNIDNLKDTLTLNTDNKDYFELTGEISLKDLDFDIDKFSEVLKDANMDDEVAQITYKIDKKSYKLIQESIKLETDKTEIAEGTEAEIDVEFVVNFDKYDSGLKIKIPSEAKKAYSEDSQNILGSLFGTPEEEELIVTPDPKETEQNIINFGESSVYPEETNQYFYPEETVTPTEVTQSLSFYDYYSNIFASIGLPNNYVFRDYTDITGQVYYGNGEYSIAYISSYPEDSYEACCDYEQSYLQSNQYATLVSTKEGVNIDGTKYMAFYELDNSSDNVDIVVVIGDNNNSVMITVSGYFVEEYGLDLEKVMEDLVNSVHFPTSLATNF